MPALLYFNASWLGYLLEPLMQSEDSAMFASSDLGNTFPESLFSVAPILTNAIESTSDMLSLAWSHATFTGDGSLISQYVCW